MVNKCVTPLLLHAASSILPPNPYSFRESLIRDIVELDMSDSNYEVALWLLRERFGRKEHIIEDHMTRLLKGKALSDSRNISQLHNLVDEAEIGGRRVTSLGATVSTDG